MGKPTNTKKAAAPKQAEKKVTTAKNGVKKGPTPAPAPEPVPAPKATTAKPVAKSPAPTKRAVKPKAAAVIAKPAKAAPVTPSVPAPAPTPTPAPVAKVTRPAASTTKRASKPATPRKTASRSKNGSAKAAYTSDDVALRAYFIGEQRQSLGQPGSPEADWLEAEKQLSEGVV